MDHNYKSLVVVWCCMPCAKIWTLKIECPVDQKDIHYRHKDGQINLVHHYYLLLLIYVVDQGVWFPFCSLIINHRVCMQDQY
jgi:hypothetical protein